MSIPKTPHSRRYERAIALGADPRVTAIQQAARNCDAGGRARAHTMAGDYAGPRNYVAMLDELKLHGVPGEQILAYGQSFLDAATRTVYEGAPVPKETLGEALALEAAAECEANQATALLVDAPHCPTRRQRLSQAFTLQIFRADFVRRILLSRGAAAR